MYVIKVLIFAASSYKKKVIDTRRLPNHSNVNNIHYIYSMQNFATSFWFLVYFRFYLTPLNAHAAAVVRVLEMYSKGPTSVNTTLSNYYQFPPPDNSSTSPRNSVLSIINDYNNDDDNTRLYPKNYSYTSGVNSNLEQVENQQTSRYKPRSIKSFSFLNHHTTSTNDIVTTNIMMKSSPSMYFGAGHNNSSSNNNNGSPDQQQQQKQRKGGFFRRLFGNKNTSSPSSPSSSISTHHTKNISINTNLSNNSNGYGYGSGATETKLDNSPSHNRHLKNSSSLSSFNSSNVIDSIIVSRNKLNRSIEGKRVGRLFFHTNVFVVLFM